MVKSCPDGIATALRHHLFWTILDGALVLTGVTVQDGPADRPSRGTHTTPLAEPCLTRLTEAGGVLALARRFPLAEGTCS